MVDVSIRSLDFIGTEATHDGFFTVTDLMFNYINTLQQLELGCTKFNPPKFISTDKYYAKGIVISEHAMVKYMFGKTRNELCKHYSAPGTHIQGIKIPNFIYPPPLTAPTSFLMWYSRNNIDYDNIFGVTPPGTKKDIYIVSDSASDVIKKFLEDTQFPDNLRVHIMLHSVTIADPSSPSTLGASEPFKAPSQKEKYVHTFKDGLVLNNCSQFSILNFKTTYNNTFPPVAANPHVAANTPVTPNMDVEKRIDWYGQSKLNQKDYTFKPASIETSILALQHYINTGTRCINSLKTCTVKGPYKKNSKMDILAALRISQAKRVGDHHQIAFCHWLTQPGNFNSPQEIFTNPPNPTAPLPLFRQMNYNNSRGVKESGFFYFHQSPQTIPLGFDQPTKQNTWFFTGDWPAICFASYMGINSLIKTSERKGLSEGYFISKIN